MTQCFEIILAISGCKEQDTHRRGGGAVVSVRNTSQQEKRRGERNILHGN